MAIPGGFRSQLISILGNPNGVIDLDELDDVVESAPARGRARSQASGQGGAAGTADLGTSGELAPVPSEGPDLWGGGISPDEWRAEQYREQVRAQEAKDEAAKKAAAAERARVAGLPSPDTPNINLPPLEPYGETLNIRPDLAALESKRFKLAGLIGTGPNKYLPAVEQARVGQMGAAARGSAMESEALQSQAALSDSQARGLAPGVIRQYGTLEDAQAYASMKRQGLEKASKLYADAVTEGVRPDRLFDSGRVNRVQALLAAGAQGAVNFYYQPGTPNRAIELLDKMIDRDIDIQERDIQNRGQYADNMLAQLGLALGDRDEAKDVFRAMYLELMAKETEAAIARTADAKQRSNLENMLAGIVTAGQAYNAEYEEKRLDRRLKADTENLKQETALQKARMDAMTQARGELGKRQVEEAKSATEKFGGLIRLQRKREEYMKLFNEAYRKFGNVPGAGIFESSNAGRFAIGKWDDLVNGPASPTNPDAQIYAARLSQMGKELDQLNMSMNRTPGAQSDWEQANLLKAFGTGGRSERDTQEMIRRSVADVYNDIVRDSKSVFSTNEGRDFWIRQNIPEIMQFYPEKGGVKQTPY